MTESVDPKSLFKEYTALVKALRNNILSAVSKWSLYFCPYYCIEGLFEGFCVCVFFPKVNLLQDLLIPLTVFFTREQMN